MSSSAVAMLPGPPLDELTADVRFVRGPAPVATTSTVIWQLAPAAIVPPDRPVLPLPAAAATVPPHVFVTFGAAATKTSAGKGSVNATSFSAAPPFGFEIVKVSVDV